MLEEHHVLFTVFFFLSFLYCETVLRENYDNAAPV
jgi:hypothetical protein